MPQRTGRLARAALVVFFMATMTLPASASPISLEELRFPQETDKTDFQSTFGHARSGGRRHRGNDLMAPKMTEVYAVAAGVVSVVRTAGLGGRYLGIDHGEGWESYYMHLNNDSPGTDNGRADWAFTMAPGILVGSPVEAGQLIAWVGDSGNAEWTGPHTHFELHRNGRAINPYPYLIAAWERDEAKRQERMETEHLEQVLELLEEFAYEMR
jgi:murein DD-endopeptidase MepM/ murein hydrolase activator NlpD